MDIILIGSGNTATVLGRKSLAAGHRVIQVYSRNQEHAGRLALLLNSSAISSISAIKEKADLMLVALSDDAITPFIRAAGEINFPVAHTAGAAALDAVKNPGALYGVLWPLQSLRREVEIIPPITMLVDANKPEAREVFMMYAQSVAENVFEADDETRLKYHLAATLVNNFTNYLYTVAENFCNKEKISFKVLQPLMEETVMRIWNISPSLTQTGPAIRNDLLTLDKHRNLIKDNPALLRFYELFTQEIQRMAAGLKLQASSLQPEKL